MLFRLKCHSEPPASIKIKLIHAVYLLWCESGTGFENIQHSFKHHIWGLDTFVISQKSVTALLHMEQLNFLHVIPAQLQQPRMWEKEPLTAVRWLSPRNPTGGAQGCSAASQHLRGQTNVQSLPYGRSDFLPCIETLLIFSLKITLEDLDQAAAPRAKPTPWQISGINIRFAGKTSLVISALTADMSSPGFQAFDFILLLRRNTQGKTSSLSLRS